MRTERKWIAAGAVITILTVGGACIKESKQDVSPVVPPGSVRTILPAETLTPVEEGWARLTPQERISKLEPKSYPDIPNFDSREELKLATAQFYCEETNCAKDPKEMADNIFFVSPDRFLEEAQKDVGRKYTQEEKESALNTRLEIMNKHHQSFINVDSYERNIKKLMENNPEVVSQLEPRDFKTVVEKSLFLHIYAHMNQTEEIYTFDGFSMTLPSKDGPIKVPNIDKLNGFTFEGVRKDGSPVFINGAKEAITEQTAIIIGRETGYVSFGHRLHEGALLVDMLNKRSGITDEEFLEYANGARSLDDLFSRWGAIKNPSNPDKKAAILALAAIGLYVDGIFSFEDALVSIDTWLKPSSQ